MAVSVAVCKIFSVKEWCDLENRVRVRSSHHLIDRIRIGVLFTFHSNYGDIGPIVSFTIYSDLLVENREIFIPHMYLAPRRNGVTPSEFCEDV